MGCLAHMFGVDVHRNFTGVLWLDAVIFYLNVLALADHSGVTYGRNMLRGGKSPGEYIAAHKLDRWWLIHPWTRV